MDDFTLNIEQHRENYFPDQFLYQDDEYDRVFWTTILHTSLSTILSATPVFCIESVIRKIFGISVVV